MHVPYASGGLPFPLLGFRPDVAQGLAVPAEVQAAVEDLFARYAGPSAAVGAFAAPTPAPTGADLAGLAAELRRHLQQLHMAGVFGGALARREAMTPSMPMPMALASPPADAAIGADAAPAEALPTEAPPAAPAAPSALERAITRSSSTWLKRPMRGPLVAELQQKLRAAGFDPGPIDGQFGPRTERAVLAFQRAAGITVDGKVGPQTLGALLGRSGGAPAGTPAATGGTGTPSAGTTPAPGTTPAGPTGVGGPSAPTSPTIDGMLSWARSRIGAPYAAVNPFRFGNVPWDGQPHKSVNGSGTVWNYPKGTQVFDCSGFVVAAYREIGVDLAKMGATTSGTIASSPHLQTISQNELRPGDLITYTSSKGIGHVVIYLGDGQTIESSGSKGVHIGTVDWSRAATFKRVPLPS